MLTLAAKRTREECEEGGGLVDNRAALAKENGVKKKVLSWMETAKAAGVVTMVAQTIEEDFTNTMPLTKKKKTSKEYRQASPKVKENLKITPSDKKCSRIV